MNTQNDFGLAAGWMRASSNWHDHLIYINQECSMLTVAQSESEDILLIFNCHDSDLLPPLYLSNSLVSLSCLILALLKTKTAITSPYSQGLNISQLDTYKHTCVVSSISPD
jgi:hypothetical protein